MCDGEQRAALAAVRSLGRAGHVVAVCSHDPRALAGVSRHASHFAIVPSALADPDGFVAAVHRLGLARGIEVVLPVTDQSSAALLPARGRLEGVVVAGPDGDAFQRVSDKRLVLDAATALGIATPRQIALPDAASAARLEIETVPFPVVIKPATPVHSGRRWSVGYAADAAALTSALSRMPAAYPLLLQQRIVGPGCGVFLLVWSGRTVATFAHRRVRELPPSGGASSYSVSVAADPGLVSRSRALLDRFAFNGAAMVEFKMDAATGTPYLMEVNGRLWGSLQLAIDAGVDFPRLLVEVATGGAPAAVDGYRVGVGLRSWWQDVEGLMLRVRHHPQTLGMPPGTPGRLAALADFLRWRLADRNEVLRLDDPRPFWRQSASWVRGR